MGAGRGSGRSVEQGRAASKLSTRPGLRAGTANSVLPRFTSPWSTRCRCALASGRRRGPVRATDAPLTVSSEVGTATRRTEDRDSIRRARHPKERELAEGSKALQFGLQVQDETLRIKDDATCAPKHTPAVPFEEGGRMLPRFSAQPQEVDGQIRVFSPYAPGPV